MMTWTTVEGPIFAAAASSPPLPSILDILVRQSFTLPMTSDYQTTKLRNLNNYLIVVIEIQRAISSCRLYSAFIDCFAGLQFIVCFSIVYNYYLYILTLQYEQEIRSQNSYILRDSGRYSTYRTVIFRKILTASQSPLTEQ